MFEGYGPAPGPGTLPRAMLTIATTLLLGSLASPPVSEQPLAPLAPRTVPSRIEHVGLFKNGLAVVRRSVVLPENGVFDVEDVPAPIHGTFWIDSDGAVATRVTKRTRSEDVELELTGDVQRDLAGAKVEIERQGDRPSLVGRVVELPANASLLVLDTDEGRVYLAPSELASLRVLEPAPGTAETVEREVPVLEFVADLDESRARRVEVTYLTRGLTWTPSYRVDISDPDTLVLSQKTVISNELSDLEGVELELIAGYPNIEFGHVLSPLAVGTDLGTFFAQLGNGSGLRHSSRGDISSQIFSNTISYSAPSDTTVQPATDGVDMHHRAIGRFDLAEGDALVLPLASAEADYERIVEWKVPDLRDEYGRPTHDRHRGFGGAGASDPDAWDALRFRNPFDFPMTTAPALVMDGTRFNGQRTSTWVNPGEEATLRITKALSVRTSASEYEDGGERELVRIGGRNYRKPLVNGELLLCNHRNEPTTVVIRREFSGELVRADEDPEQRLLESGVYSVNPRNELVWTVTLEPGETRTLQYAYEVLVLH